MGDENNTGEQNWSETFEHGSVTTENRADFTKAMSKYATEGDALVGSFNAQKLVGKPYNVPENLDALDDAGKADFRSKANAAMGINISKDAESFKDFNMGAGMAEGGVANEAMGELLKATAIEKGWPVSVVQDLAEFYNGPLGAFAAEHREKASLETAEAVDKELEGRMGREALDKQSELFKRAIIAKCGSDVEKATKIANAMAKAGLTQDADMAEMLLGFIAPYAAEGGSLAGDGAGGGGIIKQASPYEAKKALFDKSPETWGKESDTWENESAQSKRALGYKQAS
jgi:hypothetical protein